MFFLKIIVKHNTVMCVTIMLILEFICIDNKSHAIIFLKLYLCLRIPNLIVYKLYDIIYDLF